LRLANGASIAISKNSTLDARGPHAAGGNLIKDKLTGLDAKLGRTMEFFGEVDHYLQNFDLTNSINILRLICGLFFIPHIYAKFFVPEALGFFVAAKFRPPAAWMYTACVIETFLAIGLIFAILPVIAGALGFVHLLVAGGAVWKVTKGKWLWNIGGYEYCLFWAICCLVVAMYYAGLG
jgi:putative oxidoreductase